MSAVRSFFNLNPEVSLSAGHDRMVVFARRAAGALAHVDDVANGKSCECFCLACGEALIARQGEIREHSFAHMSGTQCSHALEAMLHGVAVELIGRRGHIRVPPLRLQASANGPHGLLTGSVERPGKLVPIDAVALAHRPPWSRPCVVVEAQGRELLIHFAMRRGASEAKREALRQTGRAAIEFDFSKEFPSSVGHLARALFEDDRRSSWLFNPREAVLQERLASQLRVQAEEQWRAHREVIRARRALQEQRQRERAELVKQGLSLGGTAAECAEREGQASLPAPIVPPRLVPPPASVRPPRPKEFSPSVEYAAAGGRLWLLHSDKPDIYLRTEGDMKPALAILERQGAVLDDSGPGVYRISRNGWATAALELGHFWTSIHSV
jgi:hypothetical protein